MIRIYSTISKHIDQLNRSCDSWALHLADQKIYKTNCQQCLVYIEGVFFSVRIRPLFYKQIRQ